MLAGVESIHWVMDSILQIGLYDFMPLWPKTEIGEGVKFHLLFLAPTELRHADCSLLFVESLMSNRL